MLQYASRQLNYSHKTERAHIYICTTFLYILRPSDLWLGSNCSVNSFMCIPTNKNMISR